MKEMIEMILNFYCLGWDEWNGGNIFYLFKEEEIILFLDFEKVICCILMIFDVSCLVGCYFIVIGLGRYFKNVVSEFVENFGIVWVVEDGKILEFLWGLENGCFFISELLSYFMSYIVCLEVDLDNWIVMYCYVSYLLVMSFMYELDECFFSCMLW